MSKNKLTKSIPRHKTEAHRWLLNRPSFQLEDCEKQHAANPKTFGLVPLEARQSLKKGWGAALIFLRPSDMDTGFGPGAEPLWVRVTEVLAPGHYRGTLDSYPFFIENLRYDDVIEFEAKHIADIDEEDHRLQ